MPATRNLQLLTPLMDVRGALQRLGEDVELLEQIILIFLEDSPGLLHAASEALSREDSLELRRAAHSLKGMLATLGAMDGQNAAYRLEQCGASGKLADASNLIHDCSERVAELTSVLQTYLESGSEPATSGNHASATASLG